MAQDDTIGISKNNPNEIEKQIDIIEDDIAKINPRLLKLLLKDKTTGKNILWCTKDYESNGPEYDEYSQIFAELITCDNSRVVQPRAAKSKSVQEMRIRKRAEVFTPSWICNAQNNQIDEAWFGRTNVFNIPNGTGWTSTMGKIDFADTKKTWEAYIDAQRLEITCGEAPYLVSRYDTTTGGLIPVYDRIGLFDRKMRIVKENCADNASWLKWSKRALQSVFGYEFQGDSVLIARENLLYDYIDYYKDRFHKEPPFPLLREMANIVAWNIWQMDGLKYVVPGSCHDELIEHNVQQISLFDSEIVEKPEPQYRPCQGCSHNDNLRHNGQYCIIQDWRSKKPVRFVDMMKGRE